MSVTVTVTRVILEELTSQSYLTKGVLAVDITLGFCWSGCTLSCVQYGKLSIDNQIFII